MGQQREELRRVDEYGAVRERRKFTCCLGCGECDFWFTELDLVSHLRVGTEWVGGRDSDTERKEREVENRDLERRRGEDKSDIVRRERESSSESEGKRMGLAEELSVGKRMARVRVDDESIGGWVCGGRLKKRESALGNGKRFIWWW